MFIKHILGSPHNVLSFQVGAYSPGGLFYAHYDVIGLVCKKMINYFVYWIQHLKLSGTVGAASVCGMSHLLFSHCRIQ